MIDAARTSWTDVAQHLQEAADRGEPERGITVLPFGALEQHGPHLPLGTDTFQAERIGRRIAEEVEAVLLPAVPYGQTWNNAGYPGTVSLAASTVTAIAVDIGRALASSPSPASGLVIVNGDWGNRAPLHEAARTLNDGILPTIVLDYPGLDEVVAEVRESAPAAPGLHHADETETSLMLAIDPTLVRVDRYVSCYPAFPDAFGSVPMQLHPFSPSGVFGDPAPASAAKGEDMLSAVVSASLEAVTALVDRITHDRDPVGRTA